MEAVTIRGKLPGLNEYIEACRTNSKKGNRMKQNAERMIAAQVGRMEPVRERCTVHLIWHEKDRRRDPDNVAFAKKFLLDALQHCGKIPNDSSRYIAGFTDSFEYGGDYGVTLRFETEAEHERLDPD